MTFVSDGVPIDGDDPTHIQWIFEKAQERADQYNIGGVTYRLTQGMGFVQEYLEGESTVVAILHHGIEVVTVPLD